MQNFCISYRQKKTASKLLHSNISPYSAATVQRLDAASTWMGTSQPLPCADTSAEMPDWEFYVWQSGSSPSSLAWEGCRVLRKQRGWLCALSLRLSSRGWSVWRLAEWGVRQSRLWTASAQTGKKSLVLGSVAGQQGIKAWKHNGYLLVTFFTRDGWTSALCQLTPAQIQPYKMLCNGTSVLQHESLQNDVKQCYSEAVRQRAALCWVTSVVK